MYTSWAICKIYHLVTTLVKSMQHPHLAYTLSTSDRQIQDTLTRTMQLYLQVDDLSRKRRGSEVLQETFTVFGQNKASFKGRRGPRARRRVKLKLVIGEGKKLASKSTRRENEREPLSSFLPLSFFRQHVNGICPCWCWSSELIRTHNRETSQGTSQRGCRPAR